MSQQTISYSQLREMDKEEVEIDTQNGRRKRRRTLLCELSQDPELRRMEQEFLTAGVRTRAAVRARKRERDAREAIRKEALKQAAIRRVAFTLLHN